MLLNRPSQGPAPAQTTQIVVAAHDIEAGVVVALNFTPEPRHDYRIGVPFRGVWREMANTDAACYGGSGLGLAICDRLLRLPFYNSLTDADQERVIQALLEFFPAAQIGPADVQGL